MTNTKRNQRIQEQKRLDTLKESIVRWFMDEKLSAFVVQQNLKSYFGIDATIGQINVAYRRFGLKRPRNTTSARHLQAIRKRSYQKRTCSHCNSDFLPKNSSQLFCKECAPNGRYTKYVQVYGIGKKQFDSMFLSQKGKCAICNEILQEKECVIDHNHVTSKVRGLLCRVCNLRLSVVENQKFVLAAQRYLESYKFEEG